LLMVHLALQHTCLAWRGIVRDQLAVCHGRNASHGLRVRSRGLSRTVDEDRYCIDIVRLRRLEEEILWDCRSLRCNCFRQQGRSAARYETLIQLDCAGRAHRHRDGRNVVVSDLIVTAREMPGRNSSITCAWSIWLDFYFLHARVTRSRTSFAG